MADKKKKRVMNLKIAIWRELACRRKVFMLQLLPNDDFQKNMEPLKKSGVMSLCAPKTNLASPTMISNVRSKPTCELSQTSQVSVSKTDPASPIMMNDLRSLPTCEPSQQRHSGETSHTNLCTPHTSSDLPTPITNVRRKLTYEPSQPFRQSCETSQTNLFTPQANSNLPTLVSNMKSKPQTNPNLPTRVSHMRSKSTFEPSRPSWSCQTSQTNLFTSQTSSNLPIQVSNMRSKPTYEPSRPSWSRETSQINLCTPQTNSDLSTRATNMRSKPLYELSWPSLVQCPCPSTIPSKSSCPSPPSFPSPRLSGVKRKEPTSSAEFLVPQLPKSSFSNSMYANQTDDIFCKVCHVPCLSASNYKQHLNGQKHKANVEELKLRGTGVNQDCEVTKERKRCEVCNIWCMDKSAFNMHLDGKKHKAMLESARNGGGETAKRKKWCQLCAIWCQDEAALEMHLEGKKHLVRLHDTKKERRHEGRNCNATA